ncbi:MAG: cysteine--tRNA ligase [Clostridiales bacterium]|jgi:cysteinyl-tRNA synthetase|nr:cysteine--tRNA ligase [Clostridiales bacterium]
MKLFNTLSRKKEEFTPIAETVRMYSCGPTVYSFAHIGNFRTYIFTDLLRRVLKYNGYIIDGVMNITDVGHLLSDADTGEDKMQKSAKEQNKSPQEIADFYTEAFFRDIKKLNINMPERIVKATDHIDEMIAYVAALREKGYAYAISDGIYFDISRFGGYGKLSGACLDDKIAGARVEINAEKRNPADFALWKKAEKEHIMQWTSPWGMGYPGWHIECSAMSMKYLGRHFDIHTGGVDHIPVHHENEIAQNEALTGEKSVNYWVHSEFLLVDGGKMSKSLKNNYTIDDLEKRGFSALDYRFFCLNAHYRKKLNFTAEGLAAAKTALARLKAAVAAHRNAERSAALKEPISAYIAEFEEAINDDLNIPLALGALFKMVKEKKSADIYDAALVMDGVFGLKLGEETADDGVGSRAGTAAGTGEKTGEIAGIIPPEIVAMIERRRVAKSLKDYALADGIRKEIEEKGYKLIDTKDGARAEKI